MGCASLHETATHGASGSQKNVMRSMARRAWFESSPRLLSHDRNGSRSIQPIWHSMPETASRVRGRIEVVIDWAKARGAFSGENPARWRGHLANLLPKPSKVSNVEHHAAMPFDDLPAFMSELRAATGMTTRALEFTILTAARTTEAKINGLGLICVRHKN